MAHLTVIKEKNEGKFQQKVNEHLAQGFIFVSGSFTGTTWAAFLVKQ